MRSVKEAAIILSNPGVLGQCEEEQVFIAKGTRFLREKTGNSCLVTLYSNL